MVELPSNVEMAPFSRADGGIVAKVIPAFNPKYQFCVSSCAFVIKEIIQNVKAKNNRISIQLEDT
jgi:hypothetical protein